MLRNKERMSTIQKLTVLGGVAFAFLYCAFIIFGIMHATTEPPIYYE